MEMIQLNSNKDLNLNRKGRMHVLQGNERVSLTHHFPYIQIPAVSFLAAYNRHLIELTKNFSEKVKFQAYSKKLRR